MPAQASPCAACKSPSPARRSAPLTDAEGRYRVANVPATAREVTAKRIGYGRGTATLHDRRAGDDRNGEHRAHRERDDARGDGRSPAPSATRANARSGTRWRRSARPTSSRIGGREHHRGAAGEDARAHVDAGIGNRRHRGELPTARRRLALRRQSADDLRRRRARDTAHARAIRSVRSDDDGLDAFNPADIEIDRSDQGTRRRPRSTAPKRRPA